jgi:hypothetical protein
MMSPTAEPKKMGWRGRIPDPCILFAEGIGAGSEGVPSRSEWVASPPRSILIDMASRADHLSRAELGMESVDVEPEGD